MGGLYYCAAHSVFVRIFHIELIDFVNEKIFVFNFSIDRVDSNLGYTQDNIVLCIWDINNMKFNFSQEHFIELCKMVARNFS